MAARSRRPASYLLVLLALAAVSSAWWPTVTSTAADQGSAVDDTKEKPSIAAEEAKLKAEEGVEGTKGATESWAGWARDKISEGLGTKHESEKTATQQVVEKAGDVATKTKEKLSGAAGLASQKSLDAKDTVVDEAGEAKETLKSKAGDASGKIKGGGDVSVDATAKAYESAKEKGAKTTTAEEL